MEERLEEERFNEEEMLEERKRRRARTNELVVQRRKQKTALDKQKTALDKARAEKVRAEVAAFIQTLLDHSKMEERAECAGWRQPDPDTLAAVLTRLDARDLVRAARSCKAWLGIERRFEQSLWRRLVLSAWPAQANAGSGALSSMLPLRWKRQYQLLLPPSLNATYEFVLEAQDERSRACFPVRVSKAGPVEFPFRAGAPGAPFTVGAPLEFIVGRTLLGGPIQLGFNPMTYESPDLDPNPCPIQKRSLDL